MVAELVDELERLARLHRDGAISLAQFERAKERLLGPDEKKTEIRWEYRDLVVPVNRKFDRVAKAGHELDPMLLERVLVAAREGWQPDDPVNFAWLYQHGRADCKTGGFTGVSHVVRTVTIRLKRPLM